MFVDTSIDRCREQFEKYCREELEWTDDDLKIGHPGSNQYFCDKAAAAWHFWKASREQLLVVPPDAPPVNKGGHYTRFRDGFNQGRIYALEVVKSYGVRVSE